MADIFPPGEIDLGTPDWGFAESPEANVNVQRLGDGYESREPIGLNHIKDSYSPTWSFLEPEPARAAYKFIRERLLWKAVLWTHPITGEALKVVPQTVNLTYDEYNNAVLAISFKRDYNPG